MQQINDCTIFFFKQKRAYEVCGRDWSSDVCSSDLSRPDLKAKVTGVSSSKANYIGFISGVDEIGRAACRERG